MPSVFLFICLLKQAEKKKKKKWVLFYKIPEYTVKVCVRDVTIKVRYKM